jgi:DNA mismatch repair protein MutS
MSWVDNYRKIRAEIDPQAIMIVRVGDFYEAIDKDAKILADALNMGTVTLSGKIPMAGFPFSLLEDRVKQLINSGFTVAVLEEI